MDLSVIVVLVIVTALAFDFTNGFHDTANAMATSIATGAFGPRTAVAIAACLNLIGAFLSVQVAKTISGGLVDETLINPVVIFAGLVGAILWNLTTWYLGLPSSSSHALFGGLIGAAIAGIGIHSINFESLLQKVILPAVFAPIIAGGVAFTPAQFVRITALLGVGSALPFSRSQESEADHIGLVYMARAGYDPRQAVVFWKRMQRASKGHAPPEFLSDHPSDAHRVDRIRGWLPEAEQEYSPAT